MYLASWNLSDGPEFWHRDKSSISECNVTYWPVTMLSTKLPRGQLATMKHSTHKGLHVDEILNNNPSVCIHLKSSWFICRGNWLTPILYMVPLPKNYSTHLLMLQAMQVSIHSWWRVAWQWVNFLVANYKTTCTSDKTKLLVIPSAKQQQNPCSGPTHAHQDLSTHHDWPVENAMVNLPIEMKGNSNSLSVIRWGPRTKISCCF